MHHVPLQDGYMPLLEAINGGHRNVAKWLVRNGADIHSANLYGPPCVKGHDANTMQTPLQLARARKLDSVIKLLIEKGAMD
jgi:ankyrin repeat protein